MQDVPLTLNLMRERVESLYADKTVTTRFPRALVAATDGEVIERGQRLAAALTEVGVWQGDRVATLAWNAQHHLELYIAVPCMGAVLHTINARLPAETIVLLLEQAEDRVLFADRSLLARLGSVALPAYVRLVVATDDRSDDPPHDRPAVTTKRWWPAPSPRTTGPSSTSDRPRASATRREPPAHRTAGR